MKRFFTIMLGVLLIAAITAPAFAWEFAMTGETEFRFRYFARQGSQDLFGGPAGFAAVAGTTSNFTGAGTATGTIGFAGPASVVPAAGAVGVATSGVLVQGFSAKGGDASIQDQRVWLYPDIRINPAIRLRGEYWLTGSNLRGQYFVPGNEGTPSNWIQPFGYNGWYIGNDGTSGNGPTPDGMSVGLWEKWWATIQLPWGILAMGRRPAPFGPGWDTSGERDIDSESIALFAPYGPLTFGAGVYARENGADVFNENGIVTIGAGSASGVTSPASTALYVAGGTDKNRVRTPKFFFSTTYRNGPVEFGTLPLAIFHNDAHFLPFVAAGPAGRDDMTQDAFSGLCIGTGLHATDGSTPIYGDPQYLLWPTFFKYFNGRFFLNAMYAFEYMDATRKGGRPISTWADAWELEIGAMCGPAKLAVVGFYHSGDDRRGGFLDVTGATGQGNTANNTGVAGLAATVHPGIYSYDKQTRFLVFGGAEQAIQPYEFLMGIYGAGNNSYDPRGKCRFLDFMAYAARLDYAVAANLNVFGSFIYANRASNTATPVGSFRGGVPNTLLRTNPGFNAGNQQILAVPNVPDNYLGWEGDVGVNWKLLEGFTFNTLFAYWQPGDWFKYAYVDYGSLNTATINGFAYPINPNRGIDPIIGFQGSMVVDF